MKNSVALISPQGVTVDNKSNTAAWIPYGILSLGSYISKNKINCEIIDINLQKNYIEILKENDPSIIGITSTSPEFINTISTAREIKENFPEKKIILGGIHPTIFYKEILKKYEYISAIVVGEGELILHDALINFFNNNDLNNIKNVVTPINLKFFKIKRHFNNLDEIYFPDYSLIGNLDSYLNYSYNELGYRALHMVSTRGCHHSCFFCSVKQIQGNSFRVPSPSRLINFWKKTKNNYTIDGFWLKDSNFTSNWNWLSEIRALIKTESLNLHFSINSNLLDYLSKGKYFQRSNCIKKFEILKEIGVTHIWFGIESGSEKISCTINKLIRNDQIFEIINVCNNFKIKPCGFFMIGFPDENIEDIRDTFHLMNKLPLFSKRLHILQPLPGSKLFKDKSIIDEHEFKKLNFSEASMPTKHLSTEQLNSIYKEMIEYFYQNGPLPSFI